MMKSRDIDPKALVVVLSGDKEYHEHILSCLAALEN